MTAIHTTPPPPLPLVVMGVCGSGKTTVGAALAGGLGLPFADADDLHPPANVARMRAGVPLTDADRLPWLEVVGTWLASRAGTGAVISCSALRRSYRDVLRAHVPDVAFAHLHGSPATLATRLAARHDHFMPAALLESQLATLEQLEAEETGTTLDAARPVDELVAAIGGALSRSALSRSVLSCSTRSRSTQSRSTVEV